MPSGVIWERLCAVRGFVFDMDGTLVLGDRPSREPKGDGPGGKGGGSPPCTGKAGGARRRAGQQSHGLRPLPGALEITRWAADRGLPFVVFTNGTMRSPAQYARIMRELGFPVSAMIRSLTGCGLQVVGKPSLDALRSAADRIGARPDRLAVVGDDPELEVPMAHRGRSLAIAVGTGLGAMSSYNDLSASRRPHLRVRGVDELLAILIESAAGTG